MSCLKERQKKKGLELTTEFPDTPVEGLWNQEALNQIAENLLENAIKFTPEGGQVTIRVRQEDEAILEIEDTGIGMDPAEVPELFEGFKQASDGWTREYEGVGLGLTIVQGLTEVLGGTVDVTTEKGKGTRIAIRLPSDPK